MFVRSRVAVLNENILPLEICAEPAFERVKLGRIQRAIDFAPGDFVFAGGFTDEKFVFRQPTGVLAGAHDQRPKMTQGCLISANGLFVKRRRGQIPIDMAEIVQTEMFKTFFARLGSGCNFLHRSILQRTQHGHSNPPA
jgi:hypothetical protein